MKLTNDEKILQEIVKKAWEDHDFKSNLIAVAAIIDFRATKRPVSE